MTKTVESYLNALDRELQRWIGFAKALRKEDREVFDQLMEICRNYAPAARNASRPVLSEPMMMSIMLHQQKTINKLEKKIVAARNQSTKP